MILHHHSMENLIGYVLLILGLQTVLVLFHSSCIQQVQGETCFGISSSNTQTCYGRGSCAVDNFCNCNMDLTLGSSSPYSGLNCEVDLCFPNGIISYNCNGNGQCENGVCRCKEGTSGFMCHLNSTKLMCFGVSAGDSMVCYGHGKCLDMDVCSCEDGYTGSECQIPLCYGIPSTMTSTVCSGQGTCKGHDACECQSGFSGANCQVIGSSSQGSSIEIPPSFCGSIIDSDNRTCNGRGKCIANMTHVCVWKVTMTMTCVRVHSAFQFHNKMICTDSDVCSGNGECSYHNGGCKCKEGYFGDACEQFSCFGVTSSSEISCSGNGQCLDVDTCSCYSNLQQGNWGGENCDICDENYSGIYCNETVTCQSETFCNLLGSCFNNTCQCDDHYSGQSCSLCQDGFYGPFCNQTCSKIVTCHGHGECSRDGIFCECYQSNENGYWDDFSMCQKCKNGYFGSNCLLRFGDGFVLNSLGNEILIPLVIRPINLQSLLNCSLILDLKSAMLGSLPECRIDSNNLLRITIPKDSTFSPILNFDRIVLIPSGFENGIQKNESISIPFDPINTKLVLPVAKIYSNSTFILPNTDLVLLGSNMIRIERERNLTFEWSLKSSDSDFPLFQSNLNSKFSSGKFGQLTIANSDIPSTVTKFQIQLIIRNQIYNISSNPTYTTFTVLKSSALQQVYNGAYNLKFNLPTQILYVNNDMLPYNLKYSLLQDNSPISLPNSSYSIQFAISPTPSDNTFITLQNSNGILTISSAYNHDVQNNVYEGFDGQVFNTSNVYQIVGTVTHVPSGKIVTQKSIKSFFINRNSGMRPDFDLGSLNALPTQTGPVAITIQTNGHTFDSVDWDCFEWSGVGGNCSNEWMASVAASKDSNILYVPLDTFFLAKSPLYIRARVVIAGSPYYIHSPITPTQGFGFKTLNGATLFSIIAGIQLAKIDRTNSHTAIYSWMDYQFRDTVNGATVTYEVRDQDNNLLTPTSSYISLDTSQRKFTISGPNIPASVKVAKISVRFTVPNFTNFKYRAYLYLVPDAIAQPTPTSVLNYTVLENGLRKYFLNYQLTKTYVAAMSSISLKIGSQKIGIATVGPGQLVKFILPPLLDASSIIADVTYVDNRYVGGANTITQQFTLHNLPAESPSSNTFVRTIQESIQTDATSYLVTNLVMLVMNTRYLGEEYDFPTM